MLEPRPYTDFDPDSDASIEAMAHVKSLLGFIGEDPEREGLLDTPKRVVKAMNEHYWGYHADPFEPLARTFSEVENYDELVLLQNMEIQSHCEHHMVPFVGKAHVAYIPSGKVVGLSKLARVVEIFSKRLQVQEKLTAQSANTIQEALQPQGVAVIIQARHFCMCYRGVRQSNAWTTT
ncbi:MAG: GTP cyclohydrolase I FolE, partial [Phycisphaerales bacterium]